MTLRTLEERTVLEEAGKIRRRESQERARSRAAQRRETQTALKESTAPNKRDPRQVDAGFMSWLHEDLPCIGCLIEGPGPVRYGSIEAAHQKISIAAKGWTKSGLGPRTHDAKACPLCAWHHRLARNSCDTGGQAKFWSRLGVGDDVADFCAALSQAFRNGEAGQPIVLAFAAAGRARRASETPIERRGADVA